MENHKKTATGEFIGYIKDLQKTIDKGNDAIRFLQNKIDKEANRNIDLFYEKTEFKNYLAIANETIEKLQSNLDKANETIAEYQTRESCEQLQSSLIEAS